MNPEKSCTLDLSRIDSKYENGLKHIWPIKGYDKVKISFPAEFYRVFLNSIERLLNKEFGKNVPKFHFRE